MMSSLSANRPPRGGMSNSALPIDIGDASAKFIRRSAKSVRFLVRPSVLGMVTQRTGGSYWTRLERSCTAWIGREAGTEYRFESILLNGPSPSSCLHRLRQSFLDWHSTADNGRLGHRIIPRPAEMRP